MLCFNDIKVGFTCQGFKATRFGISPDGTESVLFFENTVSVKDVACPLCGGDVYIHDNYQTYLTDIPLSYGIKLRREFFGKRYKCRKCSHSFVKDTPCCYPGTRITERAALWIKGMLRNKVSISAIQDLTGIHWDTIRKVQIECMETMINDRQAELREAGYKPKYLAVDEFAIHKGHSYATSVMDLETGDVLWVGKGRTLADFAKFFEETDTSLLSAVIAVAMDMNASYNKLIQEKMPDAEIVYDRYHMQAQFGKDVLGVVRLDEARKHKNASKEVLNGINEDTPKEKKRELKAISKRESTEYSKLKKSRWALLMNHEKLSDYRNAYLEEILQNHHDLAVCYAMKEELCELFKITDKSEAEKRWQEWFQAAKASEIPALVKFAVLKEKRIPGLIAHAEHPISTGKLEGFNNKIKVAKRIGYGYRDEDYFFLLVKYISLPSVRKFSP